MLADGDLQAIDKLITKLIKPLQKDIGELKVGQVSMQKGIDELKKGQKRLERGLKREHKIGGEILTYLEKQDYTVLTRVKRLETHLGLD